MTYAELMQLLADVRAAIKALRGPFTYTALNEQLAALTAPAFMRYTLRVIDVLVTTGELTRDIAVNGGPHRYASGKREVEATAAALEAAFIFDLTDRAPPVTRVTTPASPAPITLAASSTRSPPKTPPPAAARAEKLPAIEIATPTAAPANRPAAPPPVTAGKAKPQAATAPLTLRQRVLDLLAKEPTPTAQIIVAIKADCPRLPDSSVGATLTTLKNEGLTVPPEVRGGAWRLKGTSQPTADRPARPAPAPAVASPSPAPAAASPAALDQAEIEAALAAMHRQVQAITAAFDALNATLRDAGAALQRDIAAARSISNRAGEIA